MNKRRVWIKSTFFAMMLVLIAACVFVGIFAAVAALSDGWNGESLKSAYAYKDELTIPQKTFVSGGNEYPAGHTVTYPDGSVSGGGKVSLNQVGEYTVKYSVNAGGTPQGLTEKFLVSYPAYSTSNEKSSFTYGSDVNAETEGLLVSLAQGDSLIFTQYLDFTVLTKNDVLVRGYIAPNIRGSSDFGELVIKFTDSLDPSVFIRVVYKQYDYSGAANSYVYAAANNQEYAGLHQSQGIKKNNGFGMWSGTSFVAQKVQDGSLVAAPADNYLFTLAYDADSKQLFGTGFGSGKIGDGTGLTMFSDLDDPSYYDSLWTGFPSGKAQMSVYANSYKGASANFCVTDSYYNPEMKATTFDDDGDPVVTVDTKYGNVMPDAVTGKYYPIPKATAYDEYAGECAVTATAWYNYNTANSVNVQIKEDKIYIDRVGVYAIVYEAKDRVGNIGRSVCWINASDTPNEIEFEIPSGLNGSAVAGEWITVPDIDGIIGGSGNKIVTKYVSDGGVKKQIDKGFRPEKLGTYTVTYVAVDYVGSEREKSKTVSVTDGGVPVLEKDAEFLPAYISGQKYALPELYAYYYRSGVLEKNKCTIEVTDAAGTKSYAAGSSFTPSVTKNDQPITFALKSENVLLDTVAAVGVHAWSNEGFLTVENYLVGNSFTTTKTADGIIITPSTPFGGPGGFTFANVLESSKLNFSFKDISGVTAGARIDITLSEAYNSENSVSASLVYDGAVTYLEVDGKRVQTTGNSFNGKGNEFAVMFSGNAFVCGENSLTIAKCDNGDGFEGFTDKVIFSVTFEGMTDTAAITFYQLGNYRFNQAQSDRVGPNFITNGAVGGTFLIGDVYLISAPTVCDILSPNIALTLTVSGPGGIEVFDINGVSLTNADPTKDYYLPLIDYGQYSVLYTAAEDSSFVSRPNPTRLNYAINVEDAEKPTITLTSGYTKKAKVGDTIILPNFTVSDNNSSEVNIIVRKSVLNPVGRTIQLTGNSIVCSHTGIYTVMIMAVDEAGNIATVRYTVSVS